MTRGDLEAKVTEAIRADDRYGGGSDEVKAAVSIDIVLEAAAEMVTDEGYRPFLHADGTVCAIGGSTDAVARIRRAIAAKPGDSL